MRTPPELWRISMKMPNSPGNASRTARNVWRELASPMSPRVSIPPLIAADSISMVATAINEMQSAIEEVAGNASRAAEITREAETKGNNSAQIIRNSSRAMSGSWSNRQRGSGFNRTAASLPEGSDYCRMPSTEISISTVSEALPRSMGMPKSFRRNSVSASKPMR